MALAGQALRRIGFAVFGRDLAEALDDELYRRGLQINAVLELKVDESVLVERVRTRAKQMAERGEPVRSDDTPEVCERRLDVYRAHRSGY